MTTDQALQRAYDALAARYDANRGLFDMQPVLDDLHEVAYGSALPWCTFPVPGLHIKRCLMLDGDPHPDLTDAQTVS